MLDFYEKMGMFPPESGSSNCCAYMAQLQSQCDVPGWAMGFSSARHIMCDKKLSNEI